MKLVNIKTLPAWLKEAEELTNENGFRFPILLPNSRLIECARFKHVIHSRARKDDSRGQKPEFKAEIKCQ